MLSRVLIVIMGAPPSFLLTRASSLLRIPIRCHQQVGVLLVVNVGVLPNVAPERVWCTGLILPLTILMLLFSANLRKVQ